MRNFLRFNGNIRQTDREESASRGAVPLTFCQCNRKIHLTLPPKEGNYGHTIGGNLYLVAFCSHPRGTWKHRPLCTRVPSYIYLGFYQQVLRLLDELSLFSVHSVQHINTSTITQGINYAETR